MSLVLYSGGCDSSLVLYNLAIEAFKNNNCERILALSINHNQVAAHPEHKIARKAFKDKLIERELLNKVDFLELDVTSENSHIGAFADNNGLAQPIIWSNLAMLYANNNEKIYFGYHAGDDFWIHKTEFETSLINMASVAGKNITLEYPLRHRFKSNIISSLKERGLYDCCWYCEYPNNGKPCGVCLPCKTHRTALWQIDTFYKETLCENTIDAKIEELKACLPTDVCSIAQPPDEDLKGS